MSCEYYIFAGHFGSGKTETALNFAQKKAAEGKNVTIIDLDIVNPYFRTADAANILESMGIELIASEFANSNLDMPTVAPEVMSAFYKNDGTVIFDVGGDEDGAYALGQFRRFLKDSEMFFVVNTKRPMTSREKELEDMAHMIENASGLKITGIVNNTNLGAATDENTLMSDYKVISELSEKLGVPVVMHCGLPIALKNLPDKEKAFEMKINIKMPWQI